MEKQSKYKNKPKKNSSSKPKISKKRKNNGPTCSMFLVELTRKLASKKKHEETKSIVQTIIESITNALPVKFSKRTPPKKESPIKIESLQNYAPELLPSDTLDIPPQKPVLPYQEINDDDDDVAMAEIDLPTFKQSFKIPKMPVISSDQLKPLIVVRSKVVTNTVAVNTGGEHDVASEISKYVLTLKKISLIAEEFNQKTAKNLKEIIDSVQEDLLKKLEEVKAEQKAKEEAEGQKLRLIQENDQEE